MPPLHRKPRALEKMSQAPDRRSALAERVVPARVNLSAAHAARCASVDVGTFGTTSLRHAAFPARIPL